MNSSRRCWLPTARPHPPGEPCFPLRFAGMLILLSSSAVRPPLLQDSCSMDQPAVLHGAGAGHCTGSVASIKASLTCSLEVLLPTFPFCLCSASRGRRWALPPAWWPRLRAGRIYVVGLAHTCPDQRAEKRACHLILRFGTCACSASRGRRWALLPAWWPPSKARQRQRAPEAARRLPARYAQTKRSCLAQATCPPSNLRTRFNVAEIDPPRVLALEFLGEIPRLCRLQIWSVVKAVAKVFL